VPYSNHLDEGVLVLRHGQLFAVCDMHGDVLPSERSSHGFYFAGTRFLSGLNLTLEGVRPSLLGSTVRDQDALLTVDMANPDLVQERGMRLPGETLHLFRSRFACEDTFYETVRLTNHGREPVAFDLGFDVRADFADIFEVRGIARERRGEILPARTWAAGIELAYCGLDNRLRTTTLECDPEPNDVSSRDLSYRIELEPKEVRELRLSITCRLQDPPRKPHRPPVMTADDAFALTTDELDTARAGACRIKTSNEAFNAWLARSAGDLLMMQSLTPYGVYPYAGVPWFNAVFGRDGIITARELLWVDPRVARGVLSTLAATQATERSDVQDAEPGKIVHEIRKGEMAALGEVPFGRYYGTVDATPLFIMLARDYYDVTADQVTLRAIWPAVLRALEWIERHGDLDGDGFIEYLRRSPDGLVQQGWKDSDDSVFHADGQPAEGAIALCEVQGYAYAARCAAAELAAAMGEVELAESQRDEAERLRVHFTDRFWCEDLGTFALALDGEKRPCRVRTSNAGHCLFSGIATDEQALRVTSTLMDEDTFSGWGIRTVSAKERRYNPMSYHNGSVWPHDCALVAAGMGRYGARKQVAQMLGGLFHASTYMELNRMPELFCGFHTRRGQGPTLYPKACAPQAWAAGAVFLLLEACLGIEVRGATRTVILRRPLMPSWLDWIELTGMRVGDTRIDVLLHRVRRGVAIEVLDKEGDAEVLVAKTL
jgi:glycogen debranching enzyme